MIRTWVGLRLTDMGMWIAGVGDALIGEQPYYEQNDDLFNILGIVPVPDLFDCADCRADGTTIYHEEAN